MRNYTKMMGALAAASTLVAGLAMAGTTVTQTTTYTQPTVTDSGFSGQLYAGYASRYEFRFMDRGHNLVEAGADVAYSMGDLGFSAGAWYGTWENPWFAGHETELDLYAAIHYNIADFRLKAGYTAKIFSHSIAYPANTSEWFAGVGYDLPFGLSFDSTFYYDFDELNGWYWDNRLSYTYTIVQDVLSLQAAVGMGLADGFDSQFSTKNPWGSKDGYQGWYASVGLPWNFTTNATLTPYVRYADGASHLENNARGWKGGRNLWTFGAKVSVRF